jgi:aminoglycoside 3-N-acetyltransferase
MVFELIYDMIACLSPNIEVLLRRLYWTNANKFSRFKPRFNNKKDRNIIPVYFKQIIDVLKKGGVKKRGLLIVHSSYDSLENTGLSPEEIIDALLDLIGEEGTLAMPVIRKYKDQPKKGRKYLNYNMGNVVCTYNVQRTAVITGYLPYYLMLHKGSVTSRHPLNPMTAVGLLAKPMMEHNLEGDKPSPHGPNSSWKYCLDHNALIVGLGVDLLHFLTITHVAEEAFPDWPVKDWYRERKFKIIDKEFNADIVVKERKPEWGALCFAERNLKKQLLKQNILNIEKIGSVDISFVDAQNYIKYLRSGFHKKGYPYVIAKKYMI